MNVMRDPAKIIIEEQKREFMSDAPKILNQNEKLNVSKNSAKVLKQYEEPTLEGITHYYIPIEKEEQKMNVFLNIYGRLCINKCLIYCSSK